MIRLSSIPQWYRDLNRSLEILRILSKYGLADWIHRLDLDFAKGLLTASSGERLADHPVEQRIRMALADLGPTFIKLGQLLSTRADLVGPTLANELSRLQTQIPADPPERVRALILAELGKPADELFSQFDDVPLASASIGQVHRARLPGGDEVVVKVQHADVDRKIRIDVDILAVLADLAEGVPELQIYSPKRTVQEFQRTILRELEFRREQRNLQEFAASFRESPGVRFPRPYPEYTTDRILTMEFLKGVRISQTDALLAQGCSLPELAKSGTELFLKMIFLDRMYHADPHPGNVLVLSDGCIGVLDCGMVAHLDEPLVERILDLLLALHDNDETAMTETVLALGMAPPNVDEPALRNDLADLALYYMRQNLQNLNIGALLQELTEVLRQHRIQLPANAAFLIRTLAILEGTARRLDPQVNLIELITPYVLKLQKRRLSPGRQFRRLKRLASAWENLGDAFPRHAVELLRQLRSGSFEVHLEHRGLEPTVNRLVWGLVTSFLFLGSAILWAQKTPPELYGYSIPGVAGVVASFFLGLRLMRAIAMSGHIDRPYDPDAPLNR